MVQGRSFKGPYPVPGFPQQVAEVVMPPLTLAVSGQITASSPNHTIGAARFSGTVSNVWLSCMQCGRDDSHDLYLEGDVKINGATCLTTKPRVTANNGSASSQKTSLGEADDTDSVEGVVDGTANSVNPGDLITANLNLTRTASPSTEMAQPVLVIEFVPD